MFFLSKDSLKILLIFFLFLGLEKMTHKNMMKQLTPNMSKVNSTGKYRQTTEYHFFNLDYDLESEIDHLFDSDCDSSLEGDEDSCSQSIYSLWLHASNLDIQQDLNRREANQKITIQPICLKKGILKEKHDPLVKIQCVNTTTKKNI